MSQVLEALNAAHRAILTWELHHFLRQQGEPANGNQTLAHAVEEAASQV